MKTILSKFKVGSVTDFGNNNQEVKMTPVVNGSEENKSFSIYTPSGDCRLHITNPDVQDFFKAGSEYYLEFKDKLGFKIYNDDELRQFLISNDIEFEFFEQFLIIPNMNPFLLGVEYGRFLKDNTAA